MSHHLPDSPPRRSWPARALLAAGAALKRAFQRKPVVAPDAREPVPPSPAKSALAYRQDGANHLYHLNAERIYKGRLPPHLYAIGVLDTRIDRHGQVIGLDWLRAPRHAPEVTADIERTVRQAAPFPAPAQLGTVVYTDTWLWHESGRFQLDTLTEGQD